MSSLKDTILPDSLGIYKHIAAFDVATMQWIDDLALEVLLIYAVDRVDAKALPILAEQFDVLGYKGWRLANTEADRRALIKRAIELHRYKGTLWAVKEALKSIGFSDVAIEEHVNGHWARFALTIDNEAVVVTATGFDDIKAMVEEYKNVRSYLDSVNMKLTLNDEIVFDEDEAFFNEQIIAEDTIYLTAALFFDGVADFDGQEDYSGDADTVDIT